MTAALENEGREFERPTASTQRLERLLDQARKHLIEIGTRNRLVHTNRKAKRPATLPVSHGDPDACIDVSHAAVQSDLQALGNPINGSEH